VSGPCRILIADRNRHVREFLRRELLAEGYRVQAAKDGHELLRMLEGDEAPDLLILDLEIPYLTELAILDHLKERDPPLPVIIHSLAPTSADQLPLEAEAFLEKDEDTDRLKAVVAQVIAKRCGR
jgi:CheY-like chemotaxis protein